MDDNEIIDDLIDDPQNEDSDNENQDLQSVNLTGDSVDMNLEAIYDVPVEISVLLGSTKIPVYNLLKLGRGAVVELDKKVGEELDVYVNERLVARGEVVIVENRIGITLTEIIKS